MFFFGTLGMFFLPWSGMNIIPQVGHIIMTLNITITIYTSFAMGDFKRAAIGVVIGIVVFAPFIAFQQTYVRDHPDDFNLILINTESVKQ